MKIYGVFLLILLSIERYCFLIMVYKTKCTNYVLIMVIIFSNALVLFIKKLFKKRNHIEQAMHHILDFDNVQKTPT